MAEIGTDIKKAIRLLQDGELVAIPTETVYGLAGNALNTDTVTRIFITKNRPTFDPLIVHLPEVSHLEKYANCIPPRARQLAQQFWPGPLTLLLPKKNLIPSLVTAGLDTVGLRCPDHWLTHTLLASLSFPLAAPSANPFGYVSPTTAQHVDDQLGGKIKYILDGGSCRVGLESTIVGFEKDETIIHRLGGIPNEAIERITGKVRIMLNKSSNPQAPGQLSSHYSPKKKVILGQMEYLLKAYQQQKFGVLSFQKDYGADCQLILSPSGDPTEAAKRLFDHLRKLDSMDIEFILAERLPENGLGLAINDRLNRAASS